MRQGGIKICWINSSHHLMLRQLVIFRSAPGSRRIFRHGTPTKAYYMLLHRRDQCDATLKNQAGRSDYKASEDEWKTTWSVKVPSKISIFLWRLARHSLPSGDVLQHRKMAQSSACFFCGQQDSWRHSLLECNIARCVWAL
jgi:hypothetical protein